MHTEELRGVGSHCCTYFSVLVIDHDVVWLHISVHDTHAMTVIQSSQQLVQVVSYVIISQFGVQALENAIKYWISCVSIQVHSP